MGSKSRKSQRTKNKAADFDAFYLEQWHNRWPELRIAMESPHPYISLSKHLHEEYHLDPASVWAASLLPIPAHNTDLAILDLCAAPGGKSLAFAQRLLHHSVNFSLAANDRSSQRRARLHRVLAACLSGEKTQEDDRISVHGHDASRWGLYEKGRYNYVLADVPCSSESHVIQSKKHLDQWSISRAKRLAQQAYAILLSAIDTAVTGGYILYSTCSINHGENDGVIEKALQRRPEDIQAISTEADTSLYSFSELQPETTAYGQIILPDKSGGCGPIYACVLQKS